MYFIQYSVQSRSKIVICWAPASFEPKVVVGLNVELEVSRMRLVIVLHFVFDTVGLLRPQQVHNVL